MNTVIVLSVQRTSKFTHPPKWTEPWYLFQSALIVTHCVTKNVM